MESRKDKMAHAMRAVDDKDLQWLLARLDMSGHGRFWKAVIRELQLAISGSPPQ